MNIVATFASGLFGAMISAAVSLFVFSRIRQDNVARELLSEALAVQALEEAWIVQGYDKASLSIRINEHPGLKEEKEKDPASRLWLRRVEIKAVLDEAYWNSPSKEPYAFVGTRRAWIVRNEVGPDRHQGPTKEHYPALMSSRGREE